MRARARARDREGGAPSRFFPRDKKKKQNIEGRSKGRSSPSLALSPHSTPSLRRKKSTHLSSALVPRALQGLSGLARSCPATSAQKQRWTHGRIAAVRKSLQSSKGTPQQRSSRRCLRSRGEERSVQGLLRAKEAETGSGGGGGAGGAGVFEEVDVPDASNVVVAFLSAKKTLAEASGTASAIISSGRELERVECSSE